VSSTAPSLPRQIVKRNGMYVDFDLSRVERAVTMCYESFPEEERPQTPIDKIVQSVANNVAAKYDDANTPNVENVQDLVEMALVAAGEFEAAKHYILYREEHAKQRVVVPVDVQEVFTDSAKYFATPLQQFMFFDKYSRFNWELGRRETWVETVDRVVDYLAKLSGGALGFHVYDRIRNAIINMQAMPSMRALAMAGPAAERNSMSIYNCSFMPVTDIDAFAEAMLISLAGCGVGYSVEREFVEQFPRIQRQTGEHLGDFFIEDSAEGWAEAVRFGCKTWWDGKDVTMRPDNIRKAGTPLKTKGGRASGPGPLMEVLEFCRKKILSRQGTFCRTLDAHDIMCMVGGAAVSGGVRRTAMISLFDFDDTEMRNCKVGANLDANPWRWNANNSAVWPEDISQVDIVDQMTTMYRSSRGEPGIFSRSNAKRNKPARRAEALFGSNPCGEINLRPFELCNLSIAVCRPDDTMASLTDKVEIATIIGTIQSMATTFPHMRPEWKQNCEEERLLGVDITGERDAPPGLICDENLTKLRAVALETNRKYASLLGIKQSAAVTCNKPNGNSSQFLNTASGLHVWWSEHYRRNIRVSPHTPIYRVLRDAGVPMDPENGQDERTATSWVIHFPVKAPEGALTRHDVTAIDQCEWWLMNKLCWTEHNPSVTITYQPDELLDVMRWVWEHKDLVGGMAFLPADDAKYEQLPYEEITAEEYERLASEFPEVDFSLLYAYEKTDMTEAASEVACSAGACDIQ
jgi:ribonucleoside-triphosphate reductase